MPSRSALHTHVHESMRTAFGECNEVLQQDNLWSLLPSPSAAPIHILVNSSLAHPAVWVFDPHDIADGVLKTSITDEGQMAGVIAKIQQRMNHAAKFPRIMS